MPNGNRWYYNRWFIKIFIGVASQDYAFLNCYINGTYPVSPKLSKPRGWFMTQCDDNHHCYNIKWISNSIFFFINLKFCDKLWFNIVLK